MLPHDKVIWSREWTSTMAIAATPLQVKVGNKTAWILVVQVTGSTLMCRSPMFFVFSLINLSILTNLSRLAHVPGKDATVVLRINRSQIKPLWALSGFFLQIVAALWSLEHCVLHGVTSSFCSMTSLCLQIILPLRVTF